MSQPASSRPCRVLLYSSNAAVREAVRLAVGRRVASDLPVVEWEETATHWAVQRAADARLSDLIILDGESQPAGGMGICRQLKNEIYDCPPILILTGRLEDAWLAAWSQADAAVPHPLDPFVLTERMAALLRSRYAGQSASTSLV